MAESAQPKTQPLIGVVLGSDSDLAALAPGLELLTEWEIPFELHILSAHRTPRAAAAYGQSARERGLLVLIAAVGMAAHLPGVLAAYTTLPVVGVPIAGEQLGGVDALYSVVQMPPGVPVATVGLNAGKNAILLAVEMLCLHDPIYHSKLSGFRERQAQEVLDKDAQLQEFGFAGYNVARQETP